MVHEHCIEKTKKARECNLLVDSVGERCGGGLIDDAVDLARDNSNTWDYITLDYWKRVK